jgi:hypothetical protein
MRNLPQAVPVVVMMATGLDALALLISQESIQRLSCRSVSEDHLKLSTRYTWPFRGVLSCLGESANG